MNFMIHKEIFVDSCKETKNDKNVVIETDVVIFPMDDFNNDAINNFNNDAINNKEESKNSNTDKSLKNFNPLKEKLKLLRPQNDLVWSISNTKTFQLYFHHFA